VPRRSQTLLASSLAIVSAVLSATDAFASQQVTGQATGQATGDAAVNPTPVASTPAQASDDASAVAASENPWRVEVTAWIWIVGMDGTVSARGREADVNASFGDILDASDSIFAFSGRVEAGVGAWSGFVDGVYSNLGVDDQSGPAGNADIDVDFETVLIDAGLMYRLGEWRPEGHAATRPVTLDLYAGFRYTNLDITVDPAMFPARSQSQSWFDPIVGAKLVYPFADSWRVAVNGDIGGFGAGSDFTWSTTGVLGYDFTIGSAGASAYVGYRAIGQDYSEGSGASAFTWDVVQHGPILGLSLRF
jgi:hypothetical protein